MSDYISREEAKKKHCEICLENCICYRSKPNCDELKAFDLIPAADVREVIFCKDCKHNNACLTQAFVEDASRVPFDRNTFFCADGKKEEQT